MAWSVRVTDSTRIAHHSLPLISVALLLLLLLFRSTHPPFLIRLWSTRSSLLLCPFIWLMQYSAVQSSHGHHPCISIHASPTTTTTMTTTRRTMKQQQQQQFECNMQVRVINLKRMKPLGQLSTLLWTGPGPGQYCAQCDRDLWVARSLIAFVVPSFFTALHRTVFDVVLFIIILLIIIAQIFAAGSII